MRILLTGASGLIGTAVSARALSLGHEVITAGRDGVSVDILAGCDAVINLAGAPLLGPWWTPARQQLLRASRIERTERLVDAWTQAGSRPRVLISASATGYYGDRGAAILDEDSVAGEDFLAHLCRDWEAAARQAERLGVRVVTLRTGMVVAPHGGALGQMLLPFRLGLGGPVGRGRQFWPWIHLRDEVEVILTALSDESLCGPVNAVAPEEVTSAQFAKALGRALHRPALLPVPPLALECAFDGAATVLLSSQRVAPRVLGAHGFRFRFPGLESALRDCLRRVV